MPVALDNPNDPGVISCRDMKDGQLAVIVQADFSGTIGQVVQFLRGNPYYTLTKDLWITVGGCNGSSYSAPTFKVRLLKPGHLIRVTTN